ncbi:MAG TPA: hypothetical protein VMR86_15245 [Myxococcota bacterium]|nr:hypothetical protein [Myxococcota bacterium]
MRAVASLGAAGITALSLATAVWAGVFANPVFPATCGNPDVASAMGPPNYFEMHAGGVLTVKSCSALCKTNAAQCKRAVAANGACMNTFLSRSLQFNDAECEADYPTQAKACKSNAHDYWEVTRKNDLKNTLADDRTGCANWGSDCIAACQILGQA